MSNYRSAGPVLTFVPSSTSSFHVLPAGGRVIVGRDVKSLLPISRRRATASLHRPASGYIKLQVQPADSIAKLDERPASIGGNNVCSSLTPQRKGPALPLQSARQCEMHRQPVAAVDGMLV